MKQRRAVVGVLIGVVLTLSAIVLAAGSAAPKDTAVVRVNGSPVFEEEFLMLLRQNQTQYENRLREEYGIPGGQSVLEYLDGDESEYRRLLFEQNVAFVTSCRVEQALAQEYGLVQEFTYQGFLDALEAENKNRADKIAKGEAVYGLQSFSPEQYYSYYMSNLAQLLRRELPQESLPVSDADVIAYYEGLEGGTGADGEVTRYTLYDVSAAQNLPTETQNSLYYNIEATLADKTYLSVAVGGETYSAQRKEFNSNQLREFIRQDFSAEFLLGLSTDEICGPFPLGDHWYIAQYNGVEKAETLQDNDMAVFESILRKEAYESLIAQEAAKAEVKVNPKAIIEEE